MVDIEIIAEKCVGCGACVESCKFDAIRLEVRREKTVDLSAYQGVWVVAEQKKGVIQSVTYELLGEGRKRADSLNTELAAVLIGEEIKTQAQELIYRGADFDR